MKFIHVISAVLTLSLLFILSFPAYSQSTLEDPAEQPGYKKPAVSMALGTVLPGGGHFYSGEKGTGALLLGATILTPIAVGAVMINNEPESAFNAVHVGVTLMVVPWIYSIIDSPRAAKRTNIKNGLASNKQLELNPTVIPTNGSQAGYGMTLKVNF